jgi:hypothetical protein
MSTSAEKAHIGYLRGLGQQGLDTIKRLYGAQEALTRPDNSPGAAATRRVMADIERDQQRQDRLDAAEDLQLEVQIVKDQLGTMRAEEQAEARRWLRHNDPKEIYRAKIERNAELAREASEAKQHDQRQKAWNRYRRRAQSSHPG